MGMYDYIDFKENCPNCGKMIESFQSKDKDCCLETLDFIEVNNFYGLCANCDTWIEYNIKIPINRQISDYIKTVKIVNKYNENDILSKKEK